MAGTSSRLRKRVGRAISATRRAVEQVVARDAVRLLAEPGGGVRLGVEIDEQRPLARLREAGREVDGSRRLADAALLVRECDDPAGHASSLERASDYPLPVRDAAPPYANEGPHALWHVSENPAIERFEPHVSETAEEREPLVWAIDTRHVPFYWFPRQCPRGTFWADRSTTPPMQHGSSAARPGCTRSRRAGSNGCTRPRCLPTGCPRPRSSRIRRSAATGLRGRRSSRSRCSRSATSSAFTSAQRSNCASSRTSGRSGTTSSPRRSSSAACGCGTPPLRQVTDCYLALRPAAASSQHRAGGEPGGVGSGLPDHDEARRRLLDSPAISLRRARLHPRRRRAQPRGSTAPPSATSGRHHSAATGGGASAFATATL